MSAPAVLTVHRDFAASAERVFDAWLDPADAARFLFATPEGEMVTCEIDARIGGQGLIVERRAAGDAHHRLRFEAIDRPRRLVFLFAADPAEEGEWTRVTLDIVPRPGGCTLTLTHEMDPAWAAYEDQTRKGWTMILESLGRITEKQDD
ncbi:SRPBCC domain-containing protein [Sphingomonas sp. HITSZ_GF]|uniref:SRPBCC family protein n=1 Tax=Sphingomonas sp. HITSZ_GF TaxID=3037247 RepID=UPI00240D58BF|nr:SRPBCC domain-containing protein [Sphingomonas sp. HITSZ_GF]MDG2533405.1 SRPBCC domain-containing protein [Sphingomonas sp. HITSZ_GF]